MGFFSIEGKFFKTLTKAGDFFLLAIFGAIFSLPLVTIGTSITAVYYVALKEVRDEEGYVFKSFWKSWKQNLKQSIIIELIIVVLSALIFSDIYVCYQWYGNEKSTFAKILVFGLIGIAFILLSMAMYVFAVLAKFENTIIGTMKNALVLAIHHFPQTFIMILIDAGLIYFSTLYFTAFIVTIPIIYYVNAFILARIFQALIDKKDEQIEEQTVDQTVNQTAEQTEDQTVEQIEETEQFEETQDVVDETKDDAK